MSEITERVRAAEAALGEAHGAIRDYETELRERRAAEFVEAGGCARCNGRGWVVTWDTLDSMSGCYAEYGPCPEAAVAPEAHGPEAPFNHGIGLKHDKFHSHGPKVERVRTEAEAAHLGALRGVLTDAKAERALAADAARPARGREARVIRGRKVPKGTEGRIFWTGNRGYGERVGLELPGGERVFVNAEFVEVTKG